jgi:maltose alpha-D-glucosyltransferase/alpha-amylase
LNLRNPDVHNEIKNIFDFWASLGTDGFRIDAVNYMFYDRVGAAQDNFEDGHQFFADLHRDLESTYDRQFLFFGETDLDLDAFKKYFKDLEKHDGYGIFGNLNFYVNQHLLLAYVRENTQQFINALQDMPFTDKNVWFNFIRNHDEFNTSKLSDDEQDEVLDHFDPEEKARSYGRGISRRLGPLFDYDEAKMKSIYSVLFFLPGSPVIFYGDEIGLADNIDLDERASVRTTMGWVKQQPFYGFSEYGAEKLPEKINLPKPSEPIRTVDLIEADRDSAYNWLKFLGRMRSTYQSIFGGEHQFIDTGEVAVLGSRFTDSDNHNEVLLLGNISNSERSLENLGINLSKYQIINPDFTTKLIPDDLDCLQPYQSLILIKE